MKLFNKKEKEMLEPMLVNYVKDEIFNTKIKTFEELCPNDIIKIEEIIIFDIISSLFTTAKKEEPHIQELKEKIKIDINSIYEDKGKKINHLNIECKTFNTHYNGKEYKKIGDVNIQFEVEEENSIEIYISSYSIAGQDNDAVYYITPFDVVTKMNRKNDKTSFFYSLEHILPRTDHASDMKTLAYVDPKYQYLTVEDINKILGYSYKTRKSDSELYPIFDILFYYMVKHQRNKTTTYPAHEFLVYNPDIEIGEIRVPSYIDMRDIFSGGFVNAYFGDSICHNVFNFIRQV